MRRLVLSVLLLVGLCGFAVAANAAQGKYLVILQAGRETHEGMARAVHAILYSQELKEHGHDVKLVFDGAGTEWIAEWSNPDSTDKLKPMYEKLKAVGITEIICDACATAFNVKANLVGQKVATVSEYQGHPSIAKWADEGYQLVIL